MNTALSSDLSGAAAALAGLILVFLGATAAAYDSYDAAQQDSVRERYQGRAKLSFLGFILSLGSCATSLLAQWSSHQWLVTLSAFLLALAAGALVVAGWQAYRDIS